MHHNPTHLPVPPNLPSALTTSPIKTKQKQQQQQTPKKQRKKKPKEISLWKLWCVMVYHIVYSCWQMSIARSHFSFSRPLASVTLSILDPHQDSSKSFCCCPVLWKDCSFWFCRTGSFMRSSCASMGWVLGYTNSEPWVWPERYLVSPPAPALLPPRPVGEVIC